MEQYNKTVYKMINFKDVIWENIKEHNPNWPPIPNLSYRILVIRGSGSEKTNNLISHKPDIDNTCFCTKDPCEAKYKLVITQSEIVGWSIVMILKSLLITQMIWLTLKKILMNTI